MRAIAFGAILASLVTALQAWQSNGASLVRAGRFEDALAVFRAELAGDAKSVAANNGAAVALDLLGRYPEAGSYFAAAIKSARTPLERALAERAMAIGYGFAADCRSVDTHERKAFEFYRDTGDFPNAGDVADEAARLCLNAAISTAPTSGTCADMIPASRKPISRRRAEISGIFA